ncbi:hypothetical protein Syun_018962 [Stephania yunnanensis]|uniref:Uncharacterized protein n=1 Tax=Stephania yunnanensis TaxID=152371 RepID=A0AAP0NXH9_9MAGN
MNKADRLEHVLVQERVCVLVGCEPDDICDFELQSCDTQPNVLGGAMKEFVFSGRLDNLCMGRPSKLFQQCAGASTKKKGQGKGRCSREDSHEDSSDNSKTSRRKWSHVEDVALVNAMVEMVACGVYKYNNGFKPGYLNYNYPEVGPWCLKSFPHYENCCIIFGNDRATSEDARAPEDSFEDVNDVHDSSSTSETLMAPTEEFDATPTSTRTRTTTADGRGNEAKKKRNVSNDVYIGDQMVAAAQIVANEISKVTSAIRVEHDLRDSFINAMAEFHKLTNVERAIYGSKIMGRVELMTTFMTLQRESRLPWLHAMFN